MSNREELGREHAGKDKEVFDFFSDAMKAVGSAFVLAENGNSYIEPRSQVILVFSFVDVCASYWDVYSDTSAKPRERFESWCEKYVLNKRNRNYSGTDFAKTTPERLYELRSSLVHFFGLARINPNDADEYAFNLSTNNVKKSNLQKIKEGMRRRGKKVVIFKPKQIRDIVLEGAIVMLDEWRDNINEAQQDDQKKWAHIEGIDRIYQKIKLEGAKTVPFKPSTRES